jgi:class 3 adenylate cyclase/tetratricopeptide (TPR) repeat protein
MRCAKCRADNREGRKFCAQCGVAMAAKCARCGASNEPGEKFCGECGAVITASATAAPAPPPDTTSVAPPLRVVAERLESSTVADGERKTITVLFADIKGSMSQIEDLDPEAARAIVDPALAIMAEAVNRYQGHVAQSTGDGVFALFGAPIAHEDHPQRAIYAAMRMQQGLQRYSDRLRADGKAPVEIRIGINTGEVVMRSVGKDQSHAEYLPAGHAVGLASRLQSIASTGSIALSEHTRRLVEGYFQLKALGPTRVKGVTEAVNVYEVLGLGPLRTRLQRAAGRGLTKFVGREREMETLAHAAEQARSARGQIVATIAEAGVGKSRMFYEFKLKNQSGWMVLEALSVSHGKASAYLPVIELLCSYFKIGAEDDDRTRREKVAGRLAILDPSLEDTRPYMFALLGIVESDEQNRLHWEQSFDRLDEYLHGLQNKDPLAQMDAQIRRRRTLDAIKRILLRESLNQPMMLIFEDLHWIDHETQGLLDLLADSIGTSRVLMLVNYRPEYAHLWTNKTYYTQLRLDPLGRESAERLLTVLVGDEASLKPLRDLIVQKTEGNPFFMEEIAQALVEDGSLIRNGTARLTRTLDALKIPPTVQGILASRIDRLPALEKDLLQTLAVIGKHFQLLLLRAVWEDELTLGASALSKGTEDRLTSMLEHLQLAEFIYEQPPAGDLEYTFKHALTQEVAYNSVLQERRKLLHERIGSAIERVYRDQPEDHLAELAHHYAHSSDFSKAINYLWRAANQAAQRSLYSEAMGYANRGLELVGALAQGDERSRGELKLQVILGIASMAAKGFSSDEVERSFSRACELSRRLGDPVQLFGALQGLWGFHYTRGDTDAARKAAQESMAVAQSCNERGFFRDAHRALGATLQQAGELSAARDHLEKALASLKDVWFAEGLVRFGPDPDVLCLTSLSDILFTLGYPDQSLRRSREATEVVRRESDPFSFAMAMTFVVQAHCARGEGRKAEELCHGVIKLCIECGFPYWLATANRCLSWATLLQGRLEEGIAMINAQFDANDADAEIARFNLLQFLAEAYCRLGNCERGFAALEQWSDLRSRVSAAGMDRSYHRIRGELLMKAGDIDVAEKSLLDAVQLSASQGAKSEQLRSATRLAALLGATNRRDEGRSLLAEIYGWFTEGFATADLKGAKALLDELSAGVA